MKKEIKKINRNQMLAKLNDEQLLENKYQSGYEQVANFWIANGYDEETVIKSVKSLINRQMDWYSYTPRIPNAKKLERDFVHLALEKCDYELPNEMNNSLFEFYDFYQLLGYPNYYLNGYGIVIGVVRSKVGIIESAHTIKPYLRNTYQCVDMFDDLGVKNTLYIHRIVAQTFYDVPQGKKLDAVVHHTDGKNNNFYGCLTFAKNSMWHRKLYHGKIVEIFAYENGKWQRYAPSIINCKIDLPFIAISLQIAFISKRQDDIFDVLGSKPYKEERNMKYYSKRVKTLSGNWKTIKLAVKYGE